MKYVREIDDTSLSKDKKFAVNVVVGLPGNKSPYSNRLTLVFQSLRMMYDYKLNLVVRTPRACPWESSAVRIWNVLYDL